MLIKEPSLANFVSTILDSQASLKICLVQLLPRTFPLLVRCENNYCLIMMTDKHSFNYEFHKQCPRLLLQIAQLTHFIHNKFSSCSRIALQNDRIQLNNELSSAILTRPSAHE